MKSFSDLRAVLFESVDRAVVRELTLYIVNDGQIYRQRITPIFKNLSRKVGKGTYDGVKAIKAFMYATTDGIKKYEKEFAEPGWARRSINKQTKEAIAKELLDYYTEEIGESNIVDGNEKISENELYGKEGE